LLATSKTRGCHLRHPGLWKTSLRSTPDATVLKVARGTGHLMQ
jgi:hypothetical protein